MLGPGCRDRRVAHPMPPAGLDRAAEPRHLSALVVPGVVLDVAYGLCRICGVHGRCRYRNGARPVIVLTSAETAWPRTASSKHAPETPFNAMGAHSHPIRRVTSSPRIPHASSTWAPARITNSRSIHSGPTCGTLVLRGSRQRSAGSHRTSDDCSRSSERPTLSKSQ